MNDKPEVYILCDGKLLCKSEAELDIPIEDDSNETNLSNNVVGEFELVWHDKKAMRQLVDAIKKADESMRTINRYLCYCHYEKKKHIKKQLLKKMRNSKRWRVRR